MKKKSNNEIIYLEDFCTRIGNRTAKVFTGRDRGEVVRTESHIDEIYSKERKIKIDIPAGTFSITPSFLEEFFVNIVLSYGIDEFRTNVIIIPNGYNIDIPMEEAINRIIQRKTALSK